MKKNENLTDFLLRKNSILNYVDYFLPTKNVISNDNEKISEYFAIGCKDITANLQNVVHHEVTRNFVVKFKIFEILTKNYNYSTSKIWRFFFSRKNPHLILRNNFTKK